MFRELIRKISQVPITFESWLLSAIGIILVRIFLEQYSNNISKHFVLIDLSTLVQYSASFLTILLWCIVIIIIFTKKSLKEGANIALFGFLIILTAPIIDIIFSGGNGYQIHYLFLPFKELLAAFFTGFWSTATNGMTYGIRFEIILTIIGCFSLVSIYTKDALKAIYASILMWVGIFAVDSLPSILGLFQENTIVSFIKQSIISSNIIINSSFSIQPGFTRLYEVGFNSLMTQANLIIAFISIALICIFTYKEKAKILLGNARPERILHYVILIIIGVLFGGGVTFFYSWVNVLSLILTIIAFAFAWMAAVCVNDIQDVEIDLISNKKRPIPSGYFTKDEFHVITKIFLLISFIAAYSASLYGLFFVVLYSFVFYIYSAWPLKLKRHYLGGILVIGIASTSSLLAGFFLANYSHELFGISPLLVLSLGLLFGLSSMIKDIKDYDGDKANNIKTLPVAIGLKASKIVISTIITVSVIGISIYLGKWIIAPFAVITSILVWVTLLAKNYREANFFRVYIAFLIICAIVFLLGK